MPENRTLNPRQRKVLKAGLKKVPHRRPRDQVIVDVAKSEQRSPVQLQRTPCLVANSSWELCFFFFSVVDSRFEQF